MKTKNGYYENKVTLEMGINRKNLGDNNMTKGSNCKFWNVWGLKCKYDPNGKSEWLVMIRNEDEFEYVLVWWK